MLPESLKKKKANLGISNTPLYPILGRQNQIIASGGENLKKKMKKELEASFDI